MNLSDEHAAYIRALIYPVQFERQPLDGVDRVMQMIKDEQMLTSDPADILNALQAALQSDDELGLLTPQPHSEESIRAYLSEIARRLQS